MECTVIIFYAGSEFVYGVIIFFSVVLPPGVFVLNRKGIRHILNVNHFNFWLMSSVDFVEIRLVWPFFKICNHYWTITHVWLVLYHSYFGLNWWNVDYGMDELTIDTFMILSKLYLYFISKRFFLGKHSSVIKLKKNQFHVIFLKW